ncbi:MAG: YgiW/YdeI family stress tolerance OB fold protein [Brevundimonas sp.]|uniref:YgiW/YdeI family stress tolerance OB fold protein n=1 Tax=Brevundimonas sp. TaxID=1871086 RepID=UPI00391B3F2F
MIRTLALAAASTLALSIASPALAQFQGPGATPSPASVAEILRTPVDDQKVTLSGVIVRKVGDERYIFSDGSGEIQVEIDDDDLPREPFGPRARVEIRGEVDLERNRTLEIDVDSIRLL